MIGQQSDKEHQLLHHLTRAKLVRHLKSGDYKTVSALSRALQRALDTHDKSKEGVQGLLEELMGGGQNAPKRR